MTRDDIMTSRRAAGMIKRYHTWPTLQTQTVAEHSWRVALIHEELFGDCGSHVYQYILQHDMPELHTGDIPFPVKNKYPEIRAALGMQEEHASKALGLNWPLMSVWELNKVKVCDLLEMAEFGLVERAMGNKFAEPIISSACFAAHELARTLDIWEKVYKWWSKEERRYA